MSNNVSKLFKDELSKIPTDIRTQIDWSFDIADTIASLLKEQGMTQKEFAKKLGKTESEVSRWLGGTHNFTISTLAKISSVLQHNIISIQTTTATTHQ